MLGSIDAGRGNGNWVSERALVAAARPNATISEIAAIDRPILFDKKFFPTVAYSTAQSHRAQYNRLPQPAESKRTTACKE